jgi:hypothetical protein
VHPEYRPARGAPGSTRNADTSPMPRARRTGRSPNRRRRVERRRAGRGWARPSAVRVLEVGLAVAYGSILGSWAPVPSAASIYVLPAAVVTSTLPREPAPAETRSSPGDRRDAWPVSWSPSPSAVVAGRTGGGHRDADIRWASDTLPAAPRIPVVPLAGARFAAEEQRRCSVGSLALSQRRPAAGCSAIIAEGDPVPPACRPPPVLRSTSACPAPGGRGGGSVICIRAED